MKSQSRLSTQSSLLLSLFVVFLTLYTLSACKDLYDLGALPKRLIPRTERHDLAKDYKVDFLFVIDNSSTMCEEQKRLIDRFSILSNFLFDELQGSADYRIAIVSTEIGNDRTGNSQTVGGKFLYNPADPNRYLCRDHNDNEIFAETTDCEPVSDNINPIINSQLIGDDRQELERQFRCRAMLGTGGNPYEKGLEAMRLALSCNGPNAAKFSQCCIDYGSDLSKYDPECMIPSGAAEPEFLRPDASLVVIFLSDENDCSTPNDNPSSTMRFICRPGWAIDENVDGVPDVYEQCDTLISPGECYQRECGSFIAEGPEACHQARCDIDYNIKLQCEWSSYVTLTHVEEYQQFLQGLKSSPSEQIIIAPIVGFRTYTEAGYRHIYEPETQERSLPSYCEETDDRGFLFSESCCPYGICSGHREVLDSCLFPDRGIRAVPGTRYLELAEIMDNNRLGCPYSNENSPSCLNICVDDFAAPFMMIKDRLEDQLASFCLDRLPACIVPASTLNNELYPERPCVGEELLNPDFYALRVSIQSPTAAVMMSLPTVDIADNRAVDMTERTFQEPFEGYYEVLASTQFTLELDQGDCTARLTIDVPPESGSKIAVQYLTVD